MRLPSLLLCLLLAHQAFGAANVVVYYDNFSVETWYPSELQNVSFNVTVSNTGDAAANDIVVNITESNVSIANATVSLAAGASVLVNGSYIAKVGTRVIEARADATAVVAESDESDNNASINITVPGFNLFFGNLTAKAGIGINNTFMVDFGDVVVKNVFAADTDSDINWAKLAPLGRKNDTSTVSSIDFQEADLLLNMTSFNDSINRTFSLDGVIPRFNSTFLVFNSPRENVSFINSSYVGSFQTGILWDYSDSVTNNEFDSSEREDLVFFATANDSMSCKYDLCDYEMMLPALLRHYKGSVETVTFYLEIS